MYARRAVFCLISGLYLKEIEFLFKHRRDNLYVWLLLDLLALPEPFG
ncbi:hypothetical protein [Nitrosomonas sp.]|nr:hypothetical protein [Nitrosomonas sp.]